MREHRTSLWHKATASGSRVFEGEGVQLSLPERHIYEDTKFLFLRTIAYPGHAVDEFVKFILHSFVRSPDGKVSGRTLWKGWKEWNGVDPSAETDEVAGIRRSEIIEHFRNTFNAGELVRARLDGKVQWLWRGYELTEAGGGPVGPDGTPSLQSTVEEQSEDDDGPDIEGARAVATYFSTTRTGEWRYRFRGERFSGDLYIEPEDGSPPPQRYELIAIPARGDDM